MISNNTILSDTFTIYVVFFPKMQTSYTWLKSTFYEHFNIVKSFYQHLTDGQHGVRKKK